MTDVCNQCNKVFKLDVYNVNNYCSGCDGNTCNDCFEDLRICQNCSELFCCECVNEKTVSCSHCDFINCLNCNDSEDLFKECYSCNKIFCIQNCEDHLFTCQICHSHFICYNCFHTRERFVEHSCCKNEKKYKMHHFGVVCDNCKKAKVCIDCFKVYCAECKRNAMTTTPTENNCCNGIPLKNHRYITSSTVSKKSDMCEYFPRYLKFLAFVHDFIDIVDVKMFLLQNKSFFECVETLAFIKTNCELSEIADFILNNRIFISLKHIVFIT